MTSAMSTGLNTKREAVTRRWADAPDERVYEMAYALTEQAKLMRPRRRVPMCRPRCTDTTDDHQTYDVLLDSSGAAIGYLAL